MNLLTMLGIDLLEVRFPCCKKIAYTKLSTCNAILTQCACCKTPLVRSVIVNEKANKILITVDYVVVDQKALQKNAANGGRRVGDLLTKLFDEGQLDNGQNNPA